MTRSAPDVVPAAPPDPTVVDGAGQPRPQADPKLEVRDLEVTYRSRRGDVVALHGVTFHVDEGELVSVIGRSGCGKSTLLMALDGLVPVSSGRIDVGGSAVDGPGHDRAVVFQDASLLPWRTVVRNVEYGLEAQKVPRAERRRRAEALLEVVGLSGFANRFPRQLSGGMQQRVNLARALVTEPEVLLLDEPFAALDAQTRELLQLELLRIWDLHRTTAVFVTHQIDEAVFLSDRVIVLSDRPGTVIADVAIDLPRPRRLQVKRTPEFAAYEDHLWDLVAPREVAQ